MRARYVEAEAPLARLVHDELEAFGTGGGEELEDGAMREAILALRAVTDRLGIVNLDIPFRDFKTFRSHWLQEGASGSWQARRDILDGIFESLHDELMERETQSLKSKFG